MLLGDEPQFLEDRRAGWRFPLASDLRYEILSGHRDPLQGTGNVENISSKALAFHSDRKLEPGWRLQVSMSWPARLDGVLMLRICQEISVSTSGQQAVVPIAMKPVASKSKFGHLLVGDLDPRRVEIHVKGAFH
jgi:hypothetical protein